MSAQIWHTLSVEELTELIESIPNLAAQWRPTEKGGTHRSTRGQIAAKIAAEFDRHGVEVRVNVGEMVCTICGTDRWICGPEGVSYCENKHRTDGPTLEVAAS